MKGLCNLKERKRAVVAVDIFNQQRRSFPSPLMIIQTKPVNVIIHELGECGSQSPALRLICFNIN